LKSTRYARPGFLLHVAPVVWNEITFGAATGWVGGNDRLRATWFEAPFNQRWRSCSFGVNEVQREQLPSREVT
jgi:hypothetical protein